MPSESHISTQLERDLIWAINSPSLIRPNRDCGITDWNRLHTAEIDSNMLRSAFETAQPRQVGRYFEQLIHCYLKRIRRFDVLEHGLQIQENGQTVGEIDFVYRDGTGRLCHCETAVKFYLYYPDAEESGSQFIGPNAADTLERKMHRLFQHQLRLTDGRFEGIARREAHVRGRIFYHPQQRLPDCLPPYLSPEHLKGTWIRESELDLFETQSESSKFLLIRKPNWLAPETVASGSDRLLEIRELKDSLQQHFEERRTPQLVSGLIEHASGWRETVRTFVVSDQWPRELR